MLQKKKSYVKEALSKYFEKQVIWEGEGSFGNINILRLFTGFIFFFFLQE
jgi:hypothetical protein